MSQKYEKFEGLSVEIEATAYVNEQAAMPNEIKENSAAQPAAKSAGIGFASLAKAAMKSNVKPGSELSLSNATLSDEPIGPPAPAASSNAQEAEEPRFKKCKLLLDLSIPLICLILIVCASNSVAAPVERPSGPLPVATCGKYGGTAQSQFSPGVAKLQLVPCSNTTICGSNNASGGGGVWFDTVNNVTVSTLIINSNQTTTVCEGTTESLWPPLSATWKVTLSLMPFVFVFQGILSLNMSSRYVSPLVLLFVIVLGLNFFRDAKYFKGDATPEACGKIMLEIVARMVWTLFDYAFNVFSAFFFLRVLQLWGIVEQMRIEFAQIAPNPARKILLVYFCFAIALAVVAPGGSNFVIAGAILISMNLTGLEAQNPERLASNARLGAVALFGNALTSAFNLLGVCIKVLGEDIGSLDAFSATLTPSELSTHAGKQIGKYFSYLFFSFSTLTPVVMCYIFSGKKAFTQKLLEIRPDACILLTTGFVYASLQLIVASFVGPELPCLLAGGGAGLFYLLLEKRNSIRFACPSKEAVKQRQYLLPFILLIGVLLFIGVVPGVEPALTGYSATKGQENSAAALALNPYVYKIDSGGVKTSLRFSYLTHSGMIVLVVALVTPFLVKYKVPSEETLTNGGIESPFAESHHTSITSFKQAAKEVKTRLHAISAVKAAQPSPRQRAWRVYQTAAKDSWDDVVPVLFSITSFASIAKLMDRFDMTSSIANTIVSLLESVPGVYALVMPLIGMLGSALTGSTTTSNFLFGRLQVKTSEALGLLSTTRNSVYEIGGIQILGATAGEIISPMNAVVITLMEGVNCKESVLIKQLLPVTLWWLLLCMLTSVIFLFVPGMD